MHLAAVPDVDEELDGPTQDLERTREARDAWTAPRSHLYRTSNLTSVHALARQAEAVMLEETSDWFLTMEGHDVALHDAVRPATCQKASPCDETSRQDEVAITAVALSQGAGAVSGATMVRKVRHELRFH